MEAFTSISHKFKS